MKTRALTLTSQAVTRSSGSNFIASFWFLPAEKRQAMNTIYAFCKLTDDIVDEAVGEGEKISKEAGARLEAWRKETRDACRGKPDSASSPVLRELSSVVKRYHIPEDYFLGLIEGCRMDLDKKSYKTFDELYQYCYRVASLVGLMCLEIFGYKNSRSKNYAVDLGVAFQLTNILRDIRTDLLRGRVYLPEEELRRFGLSSSGLARILEPEGIPDKTAWKNLIAFQAERADNYYFKAKENLTRADRPNLVAAEVMTSVYYAILVRIRKDPFSVLKKKVRLPRWQMGFKIMQGWLNNRLGLVP